jgi:pilus assembly protein FimV
MAALCLPSVSAWAAGLGKIMVLSPMGQPLRAELDLTASREELASLTARVASADAFKQIGIEYVPAVAGLKFALDKRADGQPFLRVSTDRPVNEPFLDFLVELTWSSGRMVREYTMLLDPPDVFAKPPAAAVAPVVAPEAATSPTTPAAPAARATAAAEPVKPASAETKTPAPPEKPTVQAGSRVVKRGDTLAKIAEETRPTGVNLDQMLLALFRGNQEAFIGSNMNRLRAGKILNIPDAGTAAGIAPEEARKAVVAQARDFNAYRRRLAGAVAATPAPQPEVKQEAAGKIAPKVEDKTAVAAPSKDKLEVSRTEAAKDTKAVQGRISALEEDLVARDKSLKEASSRITDLEKNISDLKKLAELKSQAGAQMQQSAAKPAAAEVAPPTLGKPAEVVATKPAPAPAPDEKPQATAVPDIATAVKPEEVAKPAKPAVKPVAVPKPAIEEPSFIDESPALVYGGGGLLALLLGWLGFSSWRRKQAANELPATTSRLSENDLRANSVFGTTGGQAVDTGASIQTDFSQAPLASLDAEEGVDPVAEADVYMAYGRDAQAEEILLDALKVDPNRHAVHLKLLEILSARKNVGQFETRAKDFRGLTGGVGADWDRAAAMGRALDPDNALYSAGVAEAATLAAAPVSHAAAEPEIVVPPSEFEKLRQTVTLPGRLGPLAAAAAAAPVAAAQATTLDFDLDLGSPTVSPATPAVGADTAKVPAALDFDLDLEVPAELAVPAATTTDFDIDLPLPEVGELSAGSPAAKVPAGGLDFEFDLDAPPVATPDVAHAAMPTQAPSLDLSGIDLDLGSPVAEGAAGPGDGSDNPDVATKLELAQAYEEMGDKEGARELLHEVIHEGSIRQQGLARDKLAALDA